MEALKVLLEKRPTEAVTGPALGLAVYGFATQVGLPPLLAAILAVVVAFGPLVISETVTRIRGESVAPRK
jgi:hypothetical protein